MTGFAEKIKSTLASAFLPDSHSDSSSTHSSHSSFSSRSAEYPEYPGYRLSASGTVYLPAHDNTAPNRSGAMHGDWTLEGNYFTGHGSSSQGREDKSGWLPRDRTLGDASAPKDQTLAGWVLPDRTVGFEGYNGYSGR